MRTPWFYRWGIVFCLLAALFWACEPVDTGMGTTSEDDFTLTLQVLDPSVHVGDQTPLLVRLKRTDNSNLQKGMRGVIVITTSVHGRVNISSISIDVPNDRTTEFVESLVFAAQTPGVAEVRASFLDATVLVKVLISSVSI